MYAVLDEGGFSLEQRQQLAAAAFVHTAEYDVAVASWMGNVLTDTQRGHGLPGLGRRRLGQEGSTAVRREPASAGRALPATAAAGLACAEQLHGKEMSYNNYVDADAARRTAYDFDEPAVAIIKHANPCGIAVGKDIAEAHRRAHECDPVSAYGGVIATNRPVSVELAKQVAEIFTEVLVAPAYEDGAVEILQGKKNIRAAASPRRARRPRRSRCARSAAACCCSSSDRLPGRGRRPERLDARRRRSRLRPRCSPTSPSPGRPAARSSPTRSCSPRDGASVGVGMGQVNRVDSCRLAVTRAGERAPGSVAASDAFFPFPDGLEVLLEAGVKAVVQPGGSIRDEAAIEAATKAGVTMYFTGTRHFFH